MIVLIVTHDDGDCPEGDLDNVDDYYGDLGDLFGVILFKILMI